jgi:hypothetical protein
VAAAALPVLLWFLWWLFARGHRKGAWAAWDFAAAVLGLVEALAVT